MLSPDYTLQIEDNIYKIDVADQKVYYIEAADAPHLYNELVKDDPNSPEIHYFSTSNNVLDLIGEGEVGYPSTVEDTTVIAERCGEGSAGGNKATYVDNYQTGYRNDCKLHYEKLGIYFSIIGKIQCQQRQFPSPLWTSYSAPSVTLRMSSNFKPRCWAERSADRFGSVNNDNKVSFRPWESTRGLASYLITTQMQSSGSGVVNLRTESR